MSARTADRNKGQNWTPRVRRVSAPDVAEQGKLAFINSLLGEARFTEAEAELNQILAGNPRSYRANLMMGRVQERKGDHAAAAEYFEQARAADPTRADAALLAGKAYLNLRDVERAGEAFQMALDLDPKSAGAHFGIAQVYSAANELEQAESHLKKALAFDPQLTPARALLARVHGRWGDFDSSRKELEQILATRPDQLQATLALTRIHLREHRPADAMALLHAAQKAHPDDLEVVTLLGRAKLAMEDYTGAEEALRRAHAVDPRSVQIALGLVHVLAAQGKAPEATAILDRLPGAVRQRPRVQVAYAKVYVATENYKQAAEAYRAALLRSEKGETVVAAMEAAMGKESRVDWKAVTERYQAALSEVRTTAGKEGGLKRDGVRTQARRRRQAARSGKAQA
jgi:tetratricopeptide (TPR) repeat protein